MCAGLFERRQTSTQFLVCIMHCIILNILVYLTFMTVCAMCVSAWVGFHGCVAPVCRREVGFVLFLYYFVYSIFFRVALLYLTFMNVCVCVCGGICVC